MPERVTFSRTARALVQAPEPPQDPPTKIPPPRARGLPAGGEERSASARETLPKKEANDREPESELERFPEATASATASSLR